MEISKEKLIEIRKKEREIGELKGKLDFLIKQLEMGTKDSTADELRMDCKKSCEKVIKNGIG